MNRAVIFDFDGTIADSLKVIISIYRDLTGDDREMSQAEIDEYRKMPAAKLIAQLGVPLWKVPSLLARGRKMMRARLKEVEVFEGTEHVLQSLQAAGIDLYIVSSNSTANVESFLDRHKLRRYFVEVHGSVGLFQKAAVLRGIIRQHELQASETWYVGDEARDVTASHKVGLPVVTVDWGYQHREMLERMQPEKIVSSPKELLQTLLGEAA